MFLKLNHITKGKPLVAISKWKQASFMIKDDMNGIIMEDEYTAVLPMMIYRFFFH